MKKQKKRTKSTFHAQLTESQVAWIAQTAKDYKTTKSWIVRSLVAHAQQIPVETWFTTPQQ